MFNKRKASCICSGSGERFFCSEKERSESQPLTSDRLNDLLGVSSPVFLCIGTDRIIGDSLGPMVGSMLERESCGQIPVFGTLQKPVHAMNLHQISEQIKKKHPDRMVIAVDASLGHYKEIGSVYVRSGALRPGAGVSKNLPAAGDISITGIAAPDSQQPYLSLQTARLSTIAAMAETICACILYVTKQVPHEQYMLCFPGSRRNSE